MGTNAIAEESSAKGGHLSKKERETEKEYVREFRKDMDKRLEELKVQVDALQERAVQKVTDKPILALGVAFVAGMALGIALSKASE